MTQKTQTGSIEFRGFIIKFLLAIQAQGYIGLTYPNALSLFDLINQKVGNFLYLCVGKW